MSSEARTHGTGGETARAAEERNEAGERAAVRQVTVCASAGLLGAVAFASSLAVLHAAVTDINWMRHYVSDFANGPLGWVFVSSAAVHGLGNLALGFGLYQSLEPGRWRGRAAALLGLAAIGVVIAALFPIDPEGQALSASGLVHRAAAGASFLLESVALTLFSAAFATSPRWRRFARLSFTWSAIAAVALAGLLLAVLTNRLPGLAERFALASFWLWEITTAVKLLQMFSHHAPHSSSV